MFSMKVASGSGRLVNWLCALLFLNLVIESSQGASISLSRRSIFTDSDDAPRRHYEELIASRQIRNSPDASSDEIQEKTSAPTSVSKAPGLLHMHQAPPAQVIVAKNGRLELHCDVSGSPPPAIYWLKNGQPIREAPFEVEESTNKILENDVLIPTRGLASTKSRLAIDCVDEDTEAIYTCVAESRTERITSATYVRVQGQAPGSKSACKKKTPFLAASIFMWSGTYIDEEKQDAVLLCRAAGFPQPSITWLDRDEMPISDSLKYEILPTGDLKIRHLRWKDDMGSYTCRAENQFGSDESLTFLYPTTPES